MKLGNIIEEMSNDLRAWRATKGVEKHVAVAEKENVQRSTAKLIPTIVFLGAMFFLGRAIAGAVEEMRFENDMQSRQGQERTEANANGVLTSENWGLGFGADGTQPTGNATCGELAEYNAYYVGDTSEKIIYLTFDCGYENGNTAPILDALKKHNVPATFFVVGHYLESAPELVKRMVEEGHTVGNHTYHHPDMSKISEQSAFQKEMDAVCSKFQEVTGKELAMYYRPPQGKYSTSNLQMAKDLGYSTFFWSLAYVDWNTDKQPSHEEAMKKLCGRIHPGAIVLLHSTSQTNGEIMDELLTKWEEMGYTFGKLSDLLAEQ